MSMQSISYQMLKLIIGLVVVVSIFTSLLILLDMMSVSGCYLIKLMIVNNYMYFYHQMCGLNSPNPNLTFNSKLDIMLEMLIYKNKLAFPYS